MRVNGVHHYEYIHDGGNGVKVAVVWGVPWSAVVTGTGRHLRVEEVELDGMATPELAVMILANMRFDIDVIKTKQWRCVWAKITDSELTIAEIIGEIAESLRERKEAYVSA